MSDIAVIAFLAILMALALVFFVGYLTGVMSIKETPEKKIKRLRKEIAKLEKSLPPGLREIADREWVLDRDQQPTMTDKPTYKKPSGTDDSHNLNLDGLT